MTAGPALRFARTEVAENPQIPDTAPNLLDMATARNGKKAYVETYGCQMNVADSELMQGILRRGGYALAASPEDADVILVNTCAVREKAEDRVLGRVATLNGEKNRRPEVVLAVCGCMAERMRERLVEKAPYVDLVIGPDSYRRLPELIEAVSQFGADPIVDVRLDKAETYEGVEPDRAEGVKGWISIQRGCDKFCTFCVVPFTRGRERGIAPEEVLRQARSLAEAGYREVTLLGQTVNSYRYDDVDFADLLQLVAQIDGIERIRFTSPYPVDFSSKLIDVIAREPKVCRYVHLPVQSGSDAMLAAMRRGHTIDEYRAVVAELRDKVPGIAISTDIIVGFPGEADEDYRATVALIAEMRYDFAFLFMYSERPGTFAHKNLEDSVPEDVKKARLAEIIELQERICAEVMHPHVGQVVDVLVEGESRRNPAQLVGRSGTFKMTAFARHEGVKAGDIVNVRVLETTSHTLVGELHRG
jgi:tRNA-2-methylthio-N6-dimethylallyladenosine synthase